MARPWDRYSAGNSVTTSHKADKVHAANPTTVAEIVEGGEGPSPSGGYTARRRGCAAGRANVPNGTRGYRGGLLGWVTLSEGRITTRILVAMEDEYHAYREVLAAGVQALRPGFQVITTVPSSIEAKRASFDPQVIVSSRSGAENEGDGITWIELSTDPSRPTVVRIGSRGFEQTDPTFDALLAIVDEAGRQTEAKQMDGLNGPVADASAPAD